ncbi:MAG TPA: hypothetical protein VMN36_13360 [Verrucomicrobiales bacterium]|nr:hypothetical protein [Verrucomicrobiales bacterium]
MYESAIGLLLLAHPADDAQILATLQTYMTDSDIRALADVLSDVRRRLTREF